MPSGRSERIRQERMWVKRMMMKMMRTMVMNQNYRITSLVHESKMIRLGSSTAIHLNIAARIQDKGNKIVRIKISKNKIK